MPVYKIGSNIIRSSGGSGLFREPTGESLVTADLQVSRTSGPAPLAINLDATGSTRTGWTNDEVFRNCTFTFEVVGQTGLETYSTTGGDRYYQQGGPVCNFGLRNVGSFTVRVTVDDGSGNTDTQDVAVTVSNPDTDFATTNTIAISSSGTFTGAPSGATQTTTSSTVTAVSNRRYVFRVGESGSIDIPMGVSNVIVGSFGSGAKPTVAVNCGESESLTTWPHTVIVRDIESTTLGANTSPYRWTLYNCDIRTTSNAALGVDFGGALGYFLDHHSSASSINYPRQNFVIDCTVDAGSAGALIGISGFYIQGGIMGCTVEDTHEHSARCWNSHRAFYGHNVFKGQAEESGKHAMKLHASGNNPTYNDNIATVGETWPGGLSGVGGLAGRYVVVADNVLGTAASTTQWTLSIGPQNFDSPSYNGFPSTVEGLRDVIVENNVFARGSSWTEDIHIVAVNSVSRGNTVTPSGTVSGNGITSAEYANQTSDDGPVVMRRDWCGPDYYGQIT